MSGLMIGFVGDMLVNRDCPKDAFHDMREILKVPQVLFGNLEGVYSDRPHPAPGATLVIGAPARNLDVYSEVGFTVVSMASNHVLDMGYEAMLDTRARLRSQGVQTCGIGDCDSDARQPAIVEAEGLRIAFLARASIFPIGYEARRNTPGLAPMRAYNYMRDSAPARYPGGDPPLVTTIPDQKDLVDLAEDIRLARERADLVITSFHWGEYSRPFYLTEHEKRTAKYCIDHGADMVVGHHHHTLRGIEWYKGKPIMYGLGNFVADFRLDLGEEIESAFREIGDEDATYKVGPRQGWPLLPLHKDARMTVLAWAQASQGEISQIGILPCRLTPDGLVHPVRLGSPEGDEILAYLKRCNQTQRLNGVITAEGSMTVAGFHTWRVVSAGSEE